MRVYVAGSSHEIDRVRRAMAMVHGLGAKITFDWTLDVGQWGSNPLTETTEKRAAFAQRDLDAIDEADVVWLLAPLTHPSRGACAEFGYAIAKKKPVVITGPESARRATIFFDLADVQHDDDESGIGFVDVMRMVAP